MRKKQQILGVALAVLTGVALLLLNATAAEVGKITGQVLDQRTGEPIAFATVKVEGTSLGAATDLYGYFTILNVKPGTYRVMASVVGYAVVTQEKVVVTAGKTTKMNFVMKESGLKADTVVVMAERHSIDFNTSATQRTVSAESYRLLAPLGAMPAQEALRSGLRYCLPPDFSTEEYSPIYENQFLEVVGNPLSTFSIDVDAASYSNTRRFLNDGTLPLPDAVRIEELINYFTYDYPQPEGEHPFAIITEMSTCPWNDAHRLVHIGLQGEKMASEELPPSNLVFLLDVSGSMAPPDKLPLLKTAFRLLVDQLRPEDRVAIVVYAGAAGMVLPSTPGTHKDQILDALGRLRAGGSTAGAAGIRLAYEIAQEYFLPEGNNRVILATDGDFNIGVSSTSELIRMIEEKREAGVFLSVLGFGTGNLKDGRMEQLADKGNGNYNYIDNVMEARKVLVSELGGTLYTIAKDVKIQVEFNPARIKAYRLVGYENRLLQKEDFNDDTKDAGELGSGHTVTALYEVVPVAAEFSGRGTDSLKYQTQGIKPGALASNEALTVKFRYKTPNGKKSILLEQSIHDAPLTLAASSNNFRFSAAVAEFGMLLKDSEFKSQASYDQVLELARGALGEDPGGYRREFVGLVEISEALVNTMAKR